MENKKETKFDHLELQRQLQSGANWFFWIAGLSMINTILFLLSGGLTFLVGLGITQFLDGFFSGMAEYMGFGIRVAGLLIDIAIAGMFAVFGYLARKNYSWAFVVGLIVYGIDTIILVIFGDFISIAFHGLAGYFIFKGYQAGRVLASKK